MSAYRLYQTKDNEGRIFLDGGTINDIIDYLSSHVGVDQGLYELDEYGHTVLKGVTAEEVTDYLDEQ